jgi:energy-coupling factor transport system permease protein
MVLGVFVLVLSTMAASARLFVHFLRACFRVIWPFAVSLTIVQGLFSEGTTVLLDLGPFNLKAEGLLSAATLTGRLLVGLGAATLLTLTTRPDLLMHSLVERGLPAQTAYIVVTALQIIPEFRARAQSIIDAQRSRGLETEGSMLSRLRSLFPLVAPLVLGSLMDLEERAIALEARAFTRRGHRTSLLEIPDSTIERIARWGFLLLTGAMVVVRVI